MFDAHTYALLDSFRVGDQPWHLQYTRDADFCYVSNRRDNSVSMIHLPIHAVMATITSAPKHIFDYPHGCDISTDGRYVLISNENSGHLFTPRYAVDYTGNVCVIEKNLNNQIVKVLEVGKMPTGLSIVE